MVTLADDLRVSAAEAGVDPFLLAGVMFEQSRCDQRHSSRSGFGLLGIHPEMYVVPGSPPLPIDPSDLEPRRLRDGAHNLKVGARLLRMWQEQHAEVDRRWLNSVRHRTAVAHFFWGDVVRSSGAEDRALTARRRLIERYNGDPAEAQPSAIGLPVVSPLEGAPRLATSGPGEDREGGARPHRGLDISAVAGEPVRAVADGVVIFAGVDLPDSTRRVSVPAAKVSRYVRRPLGPGGVFLCIRHFADAAIDLSRDPRRVPLPTISCYFHLASYTVSEGEPVRAGEQIAAVGRTGVKVAPPHLHLEIHVGPRVADPARVLGALVIPPKATVAYRWAMARKKVRLAALAAAAGPQ
jgi:murein DD-endopeptidase MepM/ murein hydrolase activator NlpD